MTQDNETPQEEHVEEGIPHLDELAMRLQLPKSEKPHYGVTLYGKSGNPYSLVDMLLHTTNLVAQAMHYMMAILEEVNQAADRAADGGKKHGTSQRHGQSKKTDHPKRSPESDKR